MKLRPGDRRPHPLLLPNPGGDPFVVKLSFARRHMPWVRLSDRLPHPLLLPHPRAYPLVIELGILRRRILSVCPSDPLPHSVLLPNPRVRHGKIAVRRHFRPARFRGLRDMIATLIPQQIRDPYRDSSSEIHDQVRQHD